MDLGATLFSFVAAVAIILCAFVSRGKKGAKPRIKLPKAPDSGVTKVAQALVDKEAKKKIKVVKKAASSKSPAKSLAAAGKVRRRTSATKKAEK